MGRNERITQRTIKRIEENDPRETWLWLCKNDPFIGGHEGLVIPKPGDDTFAQLGRSLGTNTKVRHLEIRLEDELPLAATDRPFFQGLQCNTSIRSINISCDNRRLVNDGVSQNIFNALSNLKSMGVFYCDLQDGGGAKISPALRSWSNLKDIRLINCHIDNEQLQHIIPAIRGHGYLQHLMLAENDIGGTGCQILSTLLQAPNTPLKYLDLSNNPIEDEGTMALAEGLTKNNKLEVLRLDGIQMEVHGLRAVLKALYNNSSINDTFFSNHTLKHIWDPQKFEESNLTSSNMGYIGAVIRVMMLNDISNKKHTAIFKILACHPNLDMEPFFEWDVKVLPDIVNWFGRARTCIESEKGFTMEIDMDARKLSAIYQFARATPMAFVPASHNKA